MFDTKLTFTFYDIIGHIIPGIFVLMLTAWVMAVPLPEQTIILTAIGVVVGYIVGHILHAISSWMLQKVWWIPSRITNPIDKAVATVRSVLLIRVRGRVRDAIRICFNSYLISPSV